MIKNGTTCNEKNRITDRHIKGHDSTEKELKSKTKHFQVPITSKQCIINPKEAALSFKLMKTQGISGSQDQKEKTASIMTTTFSDKKSPQRKFASAAIANSGELMNRTTMNTSR